MGTKCSVVSAHQLREKPGVVAVSTQSWGRERSLLSLSQPRRKHQWFLFLVCFFCVCLEAPVCLRGSTCVFNKTQVAPIIMCLVNKKKTGLIMRPTIFYFSTGISRKAEIFCFPCFTKIEIANGCKWWAGIYIYIYIYIYIGLGECAYIYIYIYIKKFKN